MSVKKSADAIFDTWQRTEPLFKQIDYNTIIPNAHWQAEVKKQYDELVERFSDHPASLQQLKKLSSHNFQPLRFLLACLQKKDLPAFINYLKKIGFATIATKKEDERVSVNKIINKYNGMIKLLCGSSKRTEQTKFLYCVANDFFDFCFNPQTFPQCKEILKNTNQHALANLMYACMWHNLSSKGWSTWHEATIKQLQDAARRGKEIVYIAGGTDSMQLLKHEIYSIRIIDPFLPTQKNYYSKGWQFLVGGRPQDTLGDTITCSFNKKTTLTLQRVSYKKGGTFTATLSSGRKRTLPHSVTTWLIFEKNTIKPVGKLTIERRFVTQNDFAPDATKSILISFNELYFVTTAGPESWGIDVKKFHPQVTIQAKQLRQPLSKAWLLSLRSADQLPLEFIQLGNCID